MKAYIINNPQLQTLGKRISGLLVLVTCWLMWIYLLFPLFTLSGWLMGDKKLVTEMRWFGGYKSLLQLLEIYGMTLLVIAMLWVCWVLYHSLRKQAVIPAANILVNDTDLCAFYKVNNDELQHCRQASAITVYFDEHGQITRLEPTNTPP
ncbi:MAG: poly-beta-1,6-N-acetyl-D-glucosamine biosynthesis protein PgaD [Methylococcales bacterium]|nr:poly-beta-1,6-N-acetyl-D-glucosamine biosynthesis protein PgaD [Methylococcales bacterium]